MGKVLEWTEKVAMETLECCNCGVLFAITQEYQIARRKDHRWFHCPNGHPQNYRGKSDADRVKELEQEKRTLAQRVEYWQAEEAKERARAEKAEKRERSLKKRVANGVCPCCHRTFQHLARHMANRHPEYVEGS